MCEDEWFTVVINSLTPDAMLSNVLLFLLS